MEPHPELDRILAELRAAREQTLAALSDLTEADFATPTDLPRWTDIRRTLLRFGDHMREHANQVEGCRASIDRLPTMPQRMLQEGEYAWGKLLASLVGLTDTDLDTRPPDGGWTMRQVLQHTLESERLYLEKIEAARQSKP